MRITRKQLRQIIKEELGALNEGPAPFQTPEEYDEYNLERKGGPFFTASGQVRPSLERVPDRDHPNADYLDRVGHDKAKEAREALHNALEFLGYSSDGFYTLDGWTGVDKFSKKGHPLGDYEFEVRIPHYRPELYLDPE